LPDDRSLVREMDFGKDCKFYDPNSADHPNHDRILCDDCEKIVEFESDNIRRLEDGISHQLGFALCTQQVQRTGRCESLRKLGAGKHQAREPVGGRAAKPPPQDSSSALVLRLERRAREFPDAESGRRRA
jgi:hypothetical protein